MENKLQKRCHTDYILLTVHYLYGSSQSSLVDNISEGI